MYAIVRSTLGPTHIWIKREKNVVRVHATLHFPQEDIDVDEVAKFLQATYREYYAMDFLALAEQVDGVFDAMEEGEEEEESPDSFEELREDNGRQCSITRIMVKSLKVSEYLVVSALVSI